MFVVSVPNANGKLAGAPGLPGSRLNFADTDPMKDIIENRTRTSSRTKLRLLTLSLRENGPLWTGLMAIYYVASAIAEKSFAAADKLRQSTSLPGVNSPRDESGRSGITGIGVLQGKNGRPHQSGRHLSLCAFCGRMFLKVLMSWKLVQALGAGLPSCKGALAS